MTDDDKKVYFSNTKNGHSHNKLLVVKINTICNTPESTQVHSRSTVYI